MVQTDSNRSLLFDEVIPLEEAIERYVKYAFDKSSRRTNEAMKKLKIDHRRLQRYLGERLEKRLQLPPEPRVELKALATAEELMTKADLTETQKTAIRRATIEAIINAVEHSGNSEEAIKVDFLVTSRQFKITVQDAGGGFDAGKIEPVDFKQKFKNGETRGWGFHIMRKSMDHVEIQSDESGTKIVMILNRK